MFKRVRQLSSLMVIVSLGLVLSACGAKATQGSLERRKDAESYSLGFQTGQNLKNRRTLDVDPNVYISGVRDALEGKKARLSPDEMRTALAEVEKILQAEARAETAASAEETLAEGKAFLEENKKQEGVRVLPSGLQYRVLREGTGRRPGEADMVTINYRGRFIGGREFANSYKQGKPLSASLSRAIHGMREGLTLMNEGARWQLYVPPELAYGQRGATGIAPNSTLVFDIELLSVGPVDGPAQQLIPMSAHSGDR